MSVVKKLHHRLLVYFIFILAGIQTTFARVWPARTTDVAAPQDACSNPGKSEMRSASWIRLPLATRKDGLERRYALEVAGAFPFVKVVPVLTRPSAVSFEIAALSSGPAISGGQGYLPTSPLYKGPFSLGGDDRSKGSPVGDFTPVSCSNSCISCDSCACYNPPSSCTGFSSCGGTGLGSCSGGLGSCAGGGSCSGCSGCSSCSSCGRSS